MNKKAAFYRAFFPSFFLVQEAFVGPVLVVFYTKYLGFSFPQMTLFFSIIMLAGSIFELPCGVISDLLGRKLGLILGEIIKVSSMISLFYIHAFGDFQFAFSVLAVIWGLGNALSSGNLMPILHEMAVDAGVGNSFRKLLSFGQGITYSVTFIASVSAGYLAKVDLSIPLKIDISICILFIIACSVLLSGDRKAKVIQNSILHAAKIMLIEISKIDYKTVIPIGLLAGLFFGASRSAFNFLQPELVLAKVDIQYWGWISSGIFLFSSLTGYVSGFVNEKLNSEKNVALFCFFLMGSSLSAIFALKGVGAIVLFLVFSGVAAVLVRPIITTRLLKLIQYESSVKTTLFSIYALLVSLVSAGIQTASGILSKYYDGNTIVGLCSVLSVGSMMFFLMHTQLKGDNE